MSKYAQALGILEFDIDGTKFTLRPVKGDNLRLLKAYQTAGKDSMAFIQAVIPFFVDIVCREEGIAKGSEDYADLEVFTEMNVSKIAEELLVAFKWVTREQLNEAASGQLKDFQKGLGK